MDGKEMWNAAVADMQKGDVEATLAEARLSIAQQQIFYDEQASLRRSGQPAARGGMGELQRDRPAPWTSFYLPAYPKSEDRTPPQVHVWRPARWRLIGRWPFLQRVPAALTRVR
jgi:hypothetical protein